MVFSVCESHFYVTTGSKCTTSSARTAESVKSCAIRAYHLNSARTLFNASFSVFAARLVDR